MPACKGRVHVCYAVESSRDGLGWKIQVSKMTLQKWQTSPKSSIISPKNTLKTRHDWLFLQSRGAGVRQVDDSHNFNHRRRPVGKSREQFREPFLCNLFCSHCHLPQTTAGDRETNLAKARVKEMMAFCLQNLSNAPKPSKYLRDLWKPLKTSKYVQNPPERSSCQHSGLPLPTLEPMSRDPYERH